jgi:sulfate adenylyltransferase subunit 1 (EFTu-like GTPase family)
MFSDAELVTKSLDEMRQEIESLLAEAARQRSEYETALKRIEDLRRESVDARPADTEKAELLWLEAENLQSESKELLRLSVEKTLKAGEIKHRLDIRAQIEAIDGSDEIWKKATKAGRN